MRIDAPGSGSEGVDVHCHARGATPKLAPAEALRYSQGRAPLAESLPATLGGATAAELGLRNEMRPLEPAAGAAAAGAGAGRWPLPDPAGGGGGPPSSEPRIAAPRA